MGKYFGTDGIRGKANEKLTASLAMNIGQALAFIDEKKVVIGCDTRISSDMLMYAVAAGALSVGKEVIFANVVSTPCLIYSSLDLKAIGVMITASHNPYYDNGLKVIKYGYKILADEQKLIEDYLDGKVTIAQKEVGFVSTFDCEKAYLASLDKLRVNSDLKIAIDTANGATSYLAKKAFNHLKNAVIINDSPDGYNINNNVGSTHLESIISKTKNDFDLGLAFDGDGDRIIVVDKEGNTYDGDILIYILAKYLKKKGKLNKDMVVLTKMSNLGIINLLNEYMINTTITDVGDKYVLESMLKNDYSLGGENSGHIITPYSHTGDGILVGLLLIMICEEENKSIKELASDVDMYPDKMVNIPVNDKSIINDVILQKRVKEIEKDLGKFGKVILRASGTENLIRVSVMAKDKQKLDCYIEELVSYVNRINKEVE